MARTDSAWDEVNGSYLTTKWAEGRNILINGTNKYLNFGSLSGESGYGFRDNGGTMQVKNSSGSWSNFGGGGGTDDQTAAEVPFTPSGNIAATDVQAAIEELDSEKAPALGADDNYVTDAEKTKLGYISVTQAVDLDQMETDIAALANGMVYKGDWDASAGSFPGAGAAQTGWFYYVSVGGTVDGVEFSVGDNIVATTDNASTTTYAANWSKHDQTDAVQSVAGLTGSISASSLRTAISVEENADVTDATNVGSSIHGATAKTTPVDADTMPLIDSEASNVLKKVTWANIKTTLTSTFLSLSGGTMSGDLVMGDQDLTGVGAVRFTQQLDNGSKTASFSVDFATDQHQKVTLTANTMTLTLDTTNIGVGVYTLEIVNGGLATLTWASETGSITWAGGAAPTLTSSGTDVVSLLWTGSVWRGQASLAFA